MTLTIQWVAFVGLFSLGQAATSPVVSTQVWELRRDDLRPERPAVVGGVVSVTVGDESACFPRYLNELGVERIRIAFRSPGPASSTLSVIWTGGSQGPDRFEVAIDNVVVGLSRAVDSEHRPHAWNRDDFACSIGPGAEHVVELRSPDGFKSPIEFAGIRLAHGAAEPYQPLCYEAIGTLARYERELGAKGCLIPGAHVWVFAPAGEAATARTLAGFLEKAYGEMKSIYGMDPIFTFSAEHYPEGHKRGWGGISGVGTIGYTTEALDRFKRLGARDVRGFVGYTEEMSHGFKAYYRCDGTYEALGVAIQEDVVRRLLPQAAADAYWLPEHEQWQRTHEAYLAAGRTNPAPNKYPWNVLYTRILNHVFLRLRGEYGPNLWPDFFRVLREKDYPLHRASKVQRMGVYADVFTELFHRDMRKAFTEYGIELDCDPPWGWQSDGR